MTKPEAPIQESRPVQSPPTEGPPTCPACGARQRTDGPIFCPVCGEPVPRVDTTP
jgi:predicted amidophosphoribosyltransferase